MTEEANGKPASTEKKGSSPPSTVLSTAQASTGTMSVLPYLFNEDKVSPDVSSEETKAMSGEVELSVVQEP
jgi:hypothetical protein